MDQTHSICAGQLCLAFIDPTAAATTVTKNMVHGKLDLVWGPVVMKEDGPLIAFPVLPRCETWGVFSFGHKCIVIKEM